MTEKAHEKAEAEKAGDEKAEAEVVEVSADQLGRDEGASAAPTSLLKMLQSLPEVVLGVDVDRRLQRRLHGQMEALDVHLYSLVGTVVGDDEEPSPLTL